MTSFGCNGHAIRHKKACRPIVPCRKRAATSCAQGVAKKCLTHLAIKWGPGGPKFYPRAWSRKRNARSDVVFTQWLCNSTQSLNDLREPFALLAIGSFQEHAYMADITVELWAVE